MVGELIKIYLKTSKKLLQIGADLTKDLLDLGSEVIGDLEQIVEKAGKKTVETKETV